MAKQLFTIVKVSRLNLRDCKLNVIHSCVHKKNSPHIVEDRINNNSDLKKQQITSVFFFCIFMVVVIICMSASLALWSTLEYLNIKWIAMKFPVKMN